jgi:hypothetical protein
VTAAGRRAGRLPPLGNPGRRRLTNPQADDWLIAAWHRRRQPLGARDWIGSCMELRTFGSRSPTAYLLEAKAWEHLGLTGDEFRRLWWAGEYTFEERDPVAVAMNQLMLTGRWQLG